MGSFTIQCPHCRQALQAESSLAGETVSCPSCGKTFAIPKLVATGPAAASVKESGTQAGKRTDYYGMWKSPLGWICAAAVIGVGLLLAQADSNVAKTFAKISPLLALGLFSLVAKK